MPGVTKAQTAKAALSKLAGQVKMTKMPEPPKPSKKNGMAVPMSDSYPPDLYLSSDQAPFVSDWKVGDEVTVLLKGKVESMSQRPDTKGKNRTSVTLRVTQAAGGTGK